MARDVLCRGRLLDAARMLEPLIEAGDAPTSGQVMLRCLMARVRLLRSGDTTAVFDLLRPFEKSEHRAGFNRGLRAETALWLGWAHAWQDDEFYDDARALNLLDEAEQGFREELDASGRCWTLIGRAHAYFTIDEYQLMLQALNEAASLQEKLNDVYAEAWIHHLSVTGARFEGRYRAAKKHAEHLERLAGEIQDDFALGLGRAHCAVLAYEMGRPPDEVIPLAEEAESLLLGSAVNPGYSLLSAYHAHIGALVRRGSWKEADRVIDECLDRIGYLGTSPAYITLHRVRIELFRGNVDDALELLDEIASSVHRHHRLLVCSIGRMYSDVFLRKNRTDDALEHARRAHRLAREAGHAGYALQALLQKAQVAIDLGQETEARRLVREAEEHADYFGLLPLAARRFLIHGRLSALRGRPVEATAFFTQALSAYSLIGDVFAVARVQVDLTRLNAASAPAEARSFALASLKTFEEVGAQTDLKIVRKLLRGIQTGDDEVARGREADVGSIMARAAVSVDLVAEAWLQAAEELAPGRWLVIYRYEDEAGWTPVHCHGDLPPDLEFPDPSTERVCEHGVDWMRLRGLPSPAFFFGMECGGDDDPACSAIERRLEPWIPVVGLALEHALLRASRLGDLSGTLNGEKRAGNLQAEGLVYASPVMRSLVRQIQRISSGHSPVLITGENGVGKSLVARILHDCGDRRNAPFVPLSCANVTPGELEELLLGRAGDSGRQGALVAADHGTLYLDNISALPPVLQPGLLRFLEEGRIFPPGGGDPIRANVRIVASSDADLHALVRGGRFREDLYYRLNVVPLRVPPLRERREEIPLLVHYFLQELTAGKPIAATVTSRAMDALIRYQWPGNVRQLRNEIERLIVFAATEPVSMIDLEDLSETIRREADSGDTGIEADGAFRRMFDGRTLDDILAAAEKSIIEQVLARNDGQVSTTAEALGLSRQGLYKKMKRLGVDSSEFHPESNGAAGRAVTSNAGNDVPR